MINRFYTVYLDLVLTDLEGRVVASANPGFQKKIMGTSLAGDPWFVAARRCRSGDDYIVGEVKPSAAHGGRKALPTCRRRWPRKRPSCFSMAKAA
ncbi:hypothetical protein ABID21_003245 [Pseudorhizobium tarimense]|uniref:Uncharacterized protein n=1 Tax=Pseudorhizobium tarimense TaxID=1079109 RepID=A0ABV2H9A7_9HYPH